MPSMSKGLDDLPIMSVTDERFILKMGLDMRMNRALPREMPLTPFYQTLESLDRLTRHRPIKRQESRVQLFEESAWETWGGLTVYRRLGR